MVDFNDADSMPANRLRPGNLVSSTYLRSSDAQAWKRFSRDVAWVRPCLDPANSTSALRRSSAVYMANSFLVVSETPSLLRAGFLRSISGPLPNALSRADGSGSFLAWLCSHGGMMSKDLRCLI